MASEDGCGEKQTSGHGKWRIAVAAWALFGCPVDPDPIEPEGSTTNASACEQSDSTTDPIGSADAVEGGIMPTSEGDVPDVSACILELVYGPCESECEVGSDHCWSYGRAGMDYRVCGVLCDEVSDCPAPPAGEALICHRGGCYIDCDESTECPDGMACANMVTMEVEETICMWEQ